MRIGFSRQRRRGMVNVAGGHDFSRALRVCRNAGFSR